MRECNSPSFAAEYFSHFREVVMRFISSSSIERSAKRRVNWYEELKSTGHHIRVNGWVRMMFDYANTDPLSVIQFLKLYTCEHQPAVSVEEASNEMQARLEQAKSIGAPDLLINWLVLIENPYGATAKAIRRFRQGHYSEPAVVKTYYKGKTYWYVFRHYTGEPVNLKLPKGCPKCEFAAIDTRTLRKYGPKAILRYVGKWQRILRNPEFSVRHMYDVIRDNIPNPGSYSESCYGLKVSHTDATWSFQNDAYAFGSLISHDEWRKLLEPVIQVLPDELFNLLDEVNDFDEELDGPFGGCVGAIHQIPKKGTVKRRSIAAPNRFLQAGLSPLADHLSEIVRRLPMDCTYNQERHDNIIRFRMEKGKYVGSVDLKAATDWLPLYWFEIISQHMHWFNSPQLKDLWELFIHISKGNWENDTHWASWNRGQPLGTLPSFPILAITHNVLWEAISYLVGEINSPYVVLGDDSITFNRAARQAYIQLMNIAGSPLSLHKSYENRLVEFAGKYFIPRQKTAFCPSFTPIYITNLFDWQRSAKLFIKYKELPKSVRKQFQRLCLSKETGTQETIYDAFAYIVGVLPWSQLSSDSAHLVEAYASYIGEHYTDPKPEPYEAQARFLIEDSVGFWPEGTGKIRRRETQEWFQQKVRPHKTSTIVPILAAIQQDIAA